MIAQRSSSRPSTRYSSHSGLDMSRRWPSTRPARLRSCSSLPGRGTAVCRTWYRIWKCGSSTHIGPAELHRHLAHPLPVAGHHRQLAQQQPHDVAVGRGRAVEDGHRPDVHGRVLALGEVEAAVERTHPVHVLLLAAPRYRCSGEGSIHVVGWPLKLGVSRSHCNGNSVTGATIACPVARRFNRPSPQPSSTRSRRSARARSTTAVRVRFTLCPAPGHDDQLGAVPQDLGDPPAVDGGGEPVVRGRHDGHRHPPQHLQRGGLVVVEERRVEGRDHRVGRLLQQLLDQAHAAGVGVVPRRTAAGG